MLVLPASVLAMTGRAHVLPALSSPLAHAHEMLFGFALAVVAGNQLGSARSLLVPAQLALWVAARVAFLVAPQSWVTAILNSAFAAVLATQAAPRLFGAAKKPRNLALPAALTGLCAAAITWELVPHAHPGGVPQRAVFATLVLFALLMLFMGGRIIAPAVAGQLYRQGQALDARVQPRVEAGLIVTCALAFAALLVPGAQSVAAAACGSAGVLAAVRLGRWRLWALRGRADLLCLASGYGWLALGLLAFGTSLALDRYASAAIHLITVGALGTLTLNVMAMSWLVRLHRRLEQSSVIVWATALVAAATACRVIGAFYAQPWLLLAAFCWAAAFALLLGLFWRVSQRY